MKPIAALLLAALLMPVSPVHGQAVDPPYQAQMERLAEILGSLYFLEPLCGETVIDWRAQMADLIALDQPSPDREARLAGAFNTGYQAYARFYRSCTASAEEAVRRLLAEGQTASRDIHARYAE